jgi:signal transduction histidine kinase
MASDRETIVGRLALGSHLRNLRVLAAYIGGIAALLTLLRVTRMVPFSWRAFAVEALTYLVFTSAITLCCYGLVYASGVFAHRLSWRRLLALVALLVAGGITGSMVAAMTVHLLLGDDLPDSWTRLLVFNGVAALFFGAAIHVYFLLRGRGEDLARELGERELLTQQLVQARTRAELSALRARVNPHFLFNTLNSIAELIPSDPERAEATVHELAHVFRHVLDASGREAVTLGEETACIERYLAIEQVRLGDRLRVRVDVGDEVRGVRIPALLLQPLVENAVKHGVARQTEGGAVEVGARLENDRCVVLVRDTGGGFGNTDGSGFGLRSVRERLDLFYGGAARMDIEERDGVTVRLSLPLISTASEAS